MIEATPVNLRPAPLLLRASLPARGSPLRLTPGPIPGHWRRSLRRYRQNRQKPPYQRRRPQTAPLTYPRHKHAATARVDGLKGITGGEGG